MKFPGGKVCAALIALFLAGSASADQKLEDRIADLYARTKSDFEKNPYFSRAGFNLKRDSKMSPYLLSPAFRGLKQLPGKIANNATPWTDAELDSVLEFAPLPEAVFRQAVIGAINVYAAQGAKNVRNPSILTVVNFDEPTNFRRFYVFDLKSGRVLFNSFTTHGSGSAVGTSLIPSVFSNVDGSHASSLGFYLTDDQAYEGGTHYHDLALHGVDGVLNSNALARAILVHSDDGMDRASITRAKTGNPRSWGCFTLPIQESGRFYGDADLPLVELVIARIQDGSVLFAYSSVKGGLEKSLHLDADAASLAADEFFAAVEAAP